MAPPFGFTRGSSSLTPSARSEASACAANASFSSITSISSMVSPARASAFCDAGTGPMPIVRGSTPATAVETMRAIGVNPCALAPSSEQTNNAAAPSLSPDELPAVTEPLPSVRNAGFSLASPSAVESARMNSSVVTCLGSPFFCGIATGTISSPNRPASRAAAAFCCDRSANASWSARLMPCCSATFSAVCPMLSMPYSSFMRGFTKRQPSDVSKSSTSRANGLLALESAYGARVMLSTPPAT